MGARRGHAPPRGRRRVALDRSERRSAGLGFANNVIGLKLDRIYRVPETGDGVGLPVQGARLLRRGRTRGSSSGARTWSASSPREASASGLLGVVGASGSGKSSVVAAGLRSSLAAGLLPGSARWRQVSIRPGEHPMAELSAALGGLAPGGDDDPDRLGHRCAGSGRAARRLRRPVRRGLHDLHRPGGGRGVRPRPRPSE